MIYPDGSKYVGHWKGGLKHGKGVYDYANGDRFEGGWLDDAKHGVGVYHYKDTGSKFYGKLHRLMPCCGYALEITRTDCAHPLTKAVQLRPPAVSAHS